MSCCIRPWNIHPWWNLYPSSISMVHSPESYEPNQFPVFYQYEKDLIKNIKDIKIQLNTILELLEKRNEPT